MNYEDLKQKLEHIQGKIKLSVGVLRTQFSENNVSAMSALQELEDLATMDISAPLNIEGQLFFGNWEKMWCAGMEDPTSMWHQELEGGVV